MHGNPLYNWSSFTGPSGRPASASPAWKAPGSAGRAQMTVHVAAQEEDEHDIAEVYIQVGAGAQRQKEGSIYWASPCLRSATHTHTVPCEAATRQ